MTDTITKQERAKFPARTWIALIMGAGVLITEKLWPSLGLENSLLFAIWSVLIFLLHAKETA